MSCATQTGVRPLHRVRGRAALVRRLRACALAVSRFALARASSPADRRWACRTFDGLDALLQVAEATETTTTETSC